MLFCPKCHTELVDKAKFCHMCGSAVEIALSACGHCQKMNPADASFCYGCAHPLRPISLTPQYQDNNSKYPMTEAVALEEALKNFFFEELKRLALLIAPQKIDDYLRAILSHDFGKIVHVRVAQVAADFSLKYKQAATPVVQLERAMEYAVTNLAIYLIVTQCRDISPVKLSEKILKHENAQRANVQLQALIFDFLDFENERERVYTNFITTSPAVLANVAKQYLYKSKEETVFFINDPTLLASGKEGFAMTEFGIYWKTATEKPQHVYYHQLARLERHKSWILINNRYFNANQSLNVKMLLLLEKLKSVFA